jgi:hypothetical protein
MCEENGENDESGERRLRENHFWGGCVREWESVGVSGEWKHFCAFLLIWNAGYGFRFLGEKVTEIEFCIVCPFIELDLRLCHLVGEVMLFKGWCGNWRTQRLHSRDSRVMFFSWSHCRLGIFLINSLILFYFFWKN